MRRSVLVLLAGLLGWLCVGRHAAAQYPSPQLPRFYYYPYYYYPHSYWPQNSPPYPEGPGQPYQRPPAYMAYPPFQEKGWRYDLFQPQKYYRGSHFWLDQF